jgi:molybdopterin molybdotransferase
MSLAPKPAPATCGCDTAASHRPLISLGDALAILRRKVRAVSGVQDLPLADARGRVLGEDIHTQESLPRFDNAAMDGFAVKFSDIGESGVTRLAISQRIAAGEAATQRLAPNTCARIFTGAPLPDGADTVIAQEEVRWREGVATFAAPRVRGRNLRCKGGDMPKGTLALEKGQRLDMAALGLAAALGRWALPVRRQIRVAILRSGDEIVAPGQPLAAGQIYDVNGTLLRAALQPAGADICSDISCPDDAGATKRLLRELALKHDLILTTGGISVGGKDHVLEAFGAAGGQLGFAGVALKPGKPVAFGTIGRACFLGLPGNPLACLAGWVLFGAPLMVRLSGASERARKRYVTLAKPLSHKPGRRELRLAQLGPAPTGGLEVASPVMSASSAHLGALRQADGFVVLPENIQSFAAGTPLEFISLTL